MPPAPPHISTLSLHDALPIFPPDGLLVGDLQPGRGEPQVRVAGGDRGAAGPQAAADRQRRSEEHTSELQSRGHLVCRLLLEKKKNPYTGRRYASCSDTLSYYI